jgi:hypothetical protein
MQAISVPLIPFVLMNLCLVGMDKEAIGSTTDSPINGCNAAYGRSGIMFRLKLVKGADLVGDDNVNKN